MPTLTDKRILVAGGTGNVGRHLVDAVLAAGGTAIVPSRSAEKLASVVDQYGAVDGRLVPLEGDIADEREAGVLLERAGRLHGAVASLGSFVGAPSTSMLDAPAADLQRALDGDLPRARRREAGPPARSSRPRPDQPGQERVNGSRMAMNS
jgi:NAD(P)-dependent dehydrogenase (short-subunit alcohol dehydrogenase family)